MKNKLGVISLIFATLPWILIYLFTSLNKLSYLGILYMMIMSSIPLIIISILAFSALIFFAVFFAVGALKSKQELKAYPILAIIIISPAVLVLIGISFFFIQALVGSCNAQIKNFGTCKLW
jgi:hypothetical protein